MYNLITKSYDMTAVGLAGKFQLDTPGVSYVVHEVSRGFYYRVGRNAGGMPLKNLFYRCLHEVETWERVSDLPQDLDEVYNVDIHIIGKVCTISAIIGRKYLETHKGFVKVLCIDDTDYA